MNIEKVRNYAKLIARSGLNIQKGQDVFLRADIEILDFVRILVEELYDAGAQYVDIEYYSTIDNHSRLDKDKEAELSSASLQRLTPWYMIPEK